MMSLRKEFSFLRKRNAVKREMKRQQLFEAFYEKSRKEIRMDALPEDLDGTIYWNYVDIYRDCMNNEYAIRNLSNHPIQFWLFNDRKEMEIAGRCRAICEKMKERDERYHNGLSMKHRVRQIYV